MANKRECVFCGNTNLSKEHIFAQWLLKELNIFNNDVLMTHANIAGMPTYCLLCICSSGSSFSTCCRSAYYNTPFREISSGSR